MTGQVTIYDRDLATSRHSLQAAWDLAMLRGGVPHAEDSIEFKFHPDYEYTKERSPEHDATIIKWRKILP